MTNFFFNSIERGQLVIDHEGYAMSDIDAAIAHAVTGARALVAHQALQGAIDMDGSIDIMAHGGVKIASVTFDQAVSVKRSAIMS